MDPRLVAISGPREGQTFRLSSDRLTVGRHASSDLHLPSPEVSRHHCEIRRENRRFHIVDLKSSHGLQVNGQPATDQVLQHSDLITLGGSTLLFLLDDVAPSAVDSSNSIHASEAPAPSLTHKPTALLSFGDTEASDGLPQTARLARDLQTLLQTASELQGPLDLDAVCRRLLDAMADTLPAERCAILMDQGGEHLTLVAESRPAEGRPAEGRPAEGRPAEGRPAEGRPSATSWTPPSPSQTVLRRVLDGGVGWLYDPQVEAVHSASVVTVGALLCAPLLASDSDPSGVLYADGRQPGAFDARHLEMLGALAQLGASALRNAQRLRSLEDENRRLRSQQLSHDMVGNGPAMQKLLGMVAKVARVDSTVLIRGESGTGKELIARAIHEQSLRMSGPMVVVNCAALPEAILESELFGYEKGAFTGAAATKEGRIERADQGTLFLDEVGELSSPVQAKLLRVLQEGEFERLGGHAVKRVDFRLVAATNRDLEAMVKEGTFREDLYYRLKVIDIRLPPLRDRPEDILLIANHFVQRYASKNQKEIHGLTEPAQQAMLGYGWPGNVRELENVIERAVVLTRTNIIDLKDLPGPVQSAPESAGPIQTQGERVMIPIGTKLEEVERVMIKETLKKTGGDKSLAAQLLGVAARTIYRKLEAMRSDESN